MKMDNWISNHNIHDLSFWSSPAFTRTPTVAATPPHVPRGEGHGDACRRDITVQSRSGLQEARTWARLGSVSLQASLHPE